MVRSGKLSAAEKILLHADSGVGDEKAADIVIPDLR